jgi:KDO2-lipid IV(A) lauroyltransferase
VSPGHALETLLVRGLCAGITTLSWKRALVAGAALGDGLRQIGLRREVARGNLEMALPERGPAEREAILRAHYRELGRVAAEYARLGSLARRPLGEIVAETRGLEHLLAARDLGRGVILMSGHYGNFELLGAFLGQINPVDIVVRPLKNAGVEALIDRERARAGVGRIPAGMGVRRIYEALRANHWVPMLADQDARRAGVFVPFMGRLASTPVGPARIALATGAPVIMGFVTRRADGRLELDIEPPLAIPDPDHPDAAQRLTAAHTARLEYWVRQRPEMWFWLHRRWKTLPPGSDASPAPLALASAMTE